MLALTIGVVLILVTVFAAVPPEALGFGLGWGKEILLFLRGGLPVFTAFIGFIAVFIGIADIKDKQDAKKEEAAMKADESKTE